jgi:hypothetical protein
MRLQLIQASQDGMAVQIYHLTILQVLEVEGWYSIAVVAAAVDFLEMVPRPTSILVTTHVALEEPHLKMVALVDQEIMLVDSAAAHLAIGLSAQAVAVAADIQAAREATVSAVAVAVVLTTMDLHKQTLQVQTTQQDL